MNLETKINEARDRLNIPKGYKGYRKVKYHLKHKRRLTLRERFMEWLNHSRFVLATVMLFIGVSYTYVYFEGSVWYNWMIEGRSITIKTCEEVKKNTLMDSSVAKAAEENQDALKNPREESNSTDSSQNGENTSNLNKGNFSAYNAEESQTDSDPFTMASGKKVYEGAVANNCLPFGTKIKVNGKIKVVEDRMNSRYGCEYFDIYMTEYDEAVKFGRKEIAYTILN